MDMLIIDKDKCIVKREQVGYVSGKDTEISKDRALDLIEDKSGLLIAVMPYTEIKFGKIVKAASKNQVILCPASSYRGTYNYCVTEHNDCMEVTTKAETEKSDLIAMDLLRDLQDKGIYRGIYNYCVTEHNDCMDLLKDLQDKSKFNVFKKCTDIIIKSIGNKHEMFNQQVIKINFAGKNLSINNITIVRYMSKDYKDKYIVETNDFDSEAEARKFAKQCIESNELIGLLNRTRVQVYKEK